MKRDWLVILLLASMMGLTLYFLNDRRLMVEDYKSRYIQMHDSIEAIHVRALADSVRWATRMEAAESLITAIKKRNYVTSQKMAFIDSVDFAGVDSIIRAGLIEDQ